MKKQRKKKTRVIAIINQKGGVGKTTTCVHLATALAENKINIIDINQKILGDEIFAMTLLADRVGSSLSLPEITDKLKTSIKDMSLEVTVQDTEVFQYMHRV